MLVLSLHGSVSLVSFLILLPVSSAPACWMAKLTFKLGCACCLKNTLSHTHRHVFYAFSRHLSNVVRLTVTTLIITKHTIQSVMETSIRQILYVHTQGIISCTTDKASSPSLTVDSKDAHSTLTLICIDDWQVLSLQFCLSFLTASASDILAHDKKGQQPWFSSICTEKSLTHKHDGHS